MSLFQLLGRMRGMLQTARPRSPRGRGKAGSAQLQFAERAAAFFQQSHQATILQGLLCFHLLPGRSYAYVGPIVRAVQGKRIARDAACSLFVIDA
jgi:hypothetical protein